MVNQLILVGRLVKSPELELTESGKKVSIITLAVPRSYKNANGEYETDFLDCTLWTSIAENTSEYCKTGDILGIKGRLQTRIIEKEDGTKYKKMEIVAEKVSFLASAKNSKKEDIIENTLEEKSELIDIDDNSNDNSDNDSGSNKNGKSGKKKK